MQYEQFASAMQASPLQLAGVYLRANAASDEGMAQLAQFAGRFVAENGKRGAGNLLAVADSLPAHRATSSQIASCLRTAASNTRHVTDRPPYLSVKPKAGAGNPNGSLRFASGAPASHGTPAASDRIMCRHWVLLAACSRKDGQRLAERMWSLSDGESACMAANPERFPRELEDRAKEVHTHPPRAELLRADALGRFIQDKAHAMPPGSQQQFSLTTLNHAMLLRLHSHQEEDGTRYWAVSLYDPNDHAQVRTTASDPATLEPLQFEDLLLGGALRADCYLAGDSHLLAVPLPHGWNDLHRPVWDGIGVPARGAEVPLDAQMLAAASAEGSSGELLAHLIHVGARDAVREFMAYQVRQPHPVLRPPPDAESKISVMGLLIHILYLTNPNRPLILHPYRGNSHGRIPSLPALPSERRSRLRLR